MEAEIATQAVGLASATDFSLINLFLRADIVVKSVIIILILASIYSWALIFNKYRLFNRIHKSSSIFEEIYGNISITLVRLAYLFVLIRLKYFFHFTGLTK